MQRKSFCVRLEYLKLPLLINLNTCIFKDGLNIEKFSLNNINAYDVFIIYITPLMFKFPFDRNEFFRVFIIYCLSYKEIYRRTGNTINIVFYFENVFLNPLDYVQNMS